LPAWRASLGCSEARAGLARTAGLGTCVKEAVAWGCVAAGGGDDWRGGRLARSGGGRPAWLLLGEGSAGAADVVLVDDRGGVAVRDVVLGAQPVHALVEAEERRPGFDVAEPVGEGTARSVGDAGEQVPVGLFRVVQRHLASPGGGTTEESGGMGSSGAGDAPMTGASCDLECVLGSDWLADCMTRCLREAEAAAVRSRLSVRRLAVA
jgi:hypothetical protein